MHACKHNVHAYIHCVRSRYVTLRTVHHITSNTRVVREWTYCGQSCKHPNIDLIYLLCNFEWEGRQEVAGSGRCDEASGKTQVVGERVGRRRYITLHQIILQWIGLHCITSHYLTLLYLASPCIALQLKQIK